MFFLFLVVMIISQFQFAKAERCEFPPKLGPFRGEISYDKVFLSADLGYTTNTEISLVCEEGFMSKMRNQETKFICDINFKWVDKDGNELHNESCIEGNADKPNNTREEFVNSP
ncbi:hypothetical protein SNEBB_011464 [Seison nebaliae]|nr:hypothetical protein SNEBB_011464 [Seison nebaliae]